jgi:signal transduction histidine kinase
MSAHNSKYRDLGTIFERYFKDSHHAFCLWDDVNNLVHRVNPVFQKFWLKFSGVTNKEDGALNDFITENIADVKQTIIEDGISLLECDQLLFQNFKQNENDIDRLKEERLVANVQAEELGEKLYHSQKQFHKIAKIAPTGILFTNTEFKIKWSNDKGFELFGSKLIIHQSLMDLIIIIEPLKFQKDLDNLKLNDQPIHFKFKIQNQQDHRDYFITCHGVSLLGIGMEKTFIFILEDHTENTYYSEEITQRNLELTHRNNELDKFLYSVSHNIRGPIASLQGLLDVFNISNLETFNELKHHLRLNLRLLNSFVEDVQNVTTNLHTHPQNQEVDIIALIEEILRFLTKIYKISPDVDLNIPTDYKIFTDYDRLTIVLKNVLKNAFLYRDKNKSNFEIIIKLRQIDYHHYLEITDNGIGI